MDLSQSKLSGDDGIDRLVAIMAALRTPETGCPWDLDQTFKTVAPYTIEEAYEVAAAIDGGDMDELRLELGDLLLQVVFHARMAEEEKLFTFDDVAHGIADKMIRRHPHVFGTGTAQSKNSVKQTWEDIKAQEATTKKHDSDHRARKPSVLDDVPPALPALMRAVKLQKRAARVGFDWPEVSLVVNKAEEEFLELKDAINQTHPEDNPDHIIEELGDLFFVFANLARHMGFCPEEAVRQANQKFIRRFHKIEQWLDEENRSPVDSSLTEMDDLWNRAKLQEKTRL